MTKKRGRGRPKLTNGKFTRRNVTITYAHINHLESVYGGISPGIRAIIDADIRQRRDAQAAPAEEEEARDKEDD